MVELQLGGATFSHALGDVIGRSIGAKKRSKRKESGEKKKTRIHPS